jgi:signal transduction histidine kinase
MASRVTGARDSAAAMFWLAGGALSIGSGIWSMHFVGMLALLLPIPLAYDLWLTLLSLLLPIAASALGLHTVRGGALSTPTLLVAGTAIGIAIVSMHYTGMAAMRMRPPIRYEPTLVGASIVIAVLGAIGSVWSAFRLRMETILSAFWKKAGSALVLGGGGIAGMHYTGMSAALIPPDSVCTAGLQVVDNVWLAGAVSAFSILFLAMTMLISALDAYAATRLETRVAERTADLGRSNQRLLEVEESERRQIARELHDRIGQNLTALGINLNVVKAELPPSTAEPILRRLDDSIALVESTGEAIVNVMSELRPPMLDDHGLLPALRWHANQFSERTGIEVEVHGDENARPRQEVEIALFRIAQEALTNVARHSGARHVRIALERSGPDWILRIGDDGTGLAKEPRRGLGMLTMKERAQALGGHVEIDSAPDGGTRVTVRIPEDGDSNPDRR